MSHKNCKICSGNLEPWVSGLFDDRHGVPGKYDVYKCAECGFGQTYPQINKKKIAKLYSDYYPRQNIDLTQYDREKMMTFDKDEAKRRGVMHDCHRWVEDGKSVLEIGCGLGYGLVDMEARGCLACGIDPDLNAEAVANKVGLNFYKGFIEDRPFGRRKFDYVIGSQVLEHTNDPKKIIEECKRRLEPGGKIIMSFPNIDSLTRKILGRNWLHWHIPFHLNHFSKKSIEELCDQTELEIEKIVTVSPNLWSILQVRRVRNKPRPGKRDSFWDGSTQKNKKTSLIDWATNRGISAFWGILERNNPLNRLIDKAGWGESWVVVLKIA